MPDTNDDVNIYKVNRGGKDYYIFEREYLSKRLPFVAFIDKNKQSYFIDTISLTKAKELIIAVYNTGLFVEPVNVSFDKIFRQELNGDKYTEWKNFLIYKRILQDDKLNVVKYKDGYIDPFFAASIFI